MAPPANICCRPTCGSIGCRLWLQSWLSSEDPPVLSVVAVGSSIVHLVLWLQYGDLSFLAPVSPPVVHGSGISSCRSRLRYLLSLFVAPVAPAVAQVLSIVTSCGSKLSLVTPVAAMVVFHPVALTGSHLVF